MVAAQWGLPMSEAKTIQTSSDLTALFEFEANQGVHLVSVGTVLQCLCVSESFLLTPPLPESWRKGAVPELIENSVKGLSVNSNNQSDSEPSGKIDLADNGGTSDEQS